MKLSIERHAGGLSLHVHKWEVTWMGRATYDDGAKNWPDGWAGERHVLIPFGAVFLAQN